jgi:asparagine synthase (glutamine-hydrolysing)
MCSILTTSQKSIPLARLEECFDRTIPRGPDMTRLVETPIGYMGFHRLAIMGLTEEGMQPFSHGTEYAGV